MRKKARLGLILTTQEKSWVRRLAEIEGGLSEAALIRRLIRQAAKSNGLQNDDSYVAIRKGVQDG